MKREPFGSDPKQIYDEARIDASDVKEYYSTDGEYDEMLAISIARLDQTEIEEDGFEIDDMPEIRICGPTGCGKTTAAQNLALDLARATKLRDEGFPVLNRQSLIEVAEERGVDVDTDGTYTDVVRDVYEEVVGELEQGIPFFDITLAHATNPADLIGHPDIDEEGSTQFIEGTMTKAVKASRVGPVIILLDEVNRAPTTGKDELYDALDHRAKVTLEGIEGGREIKGNNLNLLAVSTMNRGLGHHVEPIDTAEKRRLGGMWETSYLGYSEGDEGNPIEKEVDLITERTPAPEKTAEVIVQAANKVRRMAQNDSDVRYGVPTSSLLDWAKTAYAYNKAGIENELKKAAEATVVRAIYDHSDDEISEVRGALLTYIDGRGFDSSEHEQDQLTCNDCSWVGRYEELDDEYAELMKCPDCEGLLNPLRES